MIETSAIVQFLQQNLPGLLAVYGFGSRIQGVADSHSDLDVAVLVEGYAEPLQLWQLSGELGDIAGYPVDLLDLRAASTVMQHQIISTGERWWASDVQAGLFEAFILSEKMTLDERRALQLQDIRQAGRVYGE